MLQAYIDESVEENGVFVLAGYISTAESWDSFSKEWERLLPYGTLRPDGRHHFKMREMAQTAERMARVSLFANVIHDHVLGWISCRINIADLRRACGRISILGIDGIDWSLWRNPWYFAYRCLMDNFYLNRRSESIAQMLPVSEQVDVYFDMRSEEHAVLASWQDYVRGHPEAEAWYRTHPMFRDDMEFLPLQAADFWAWWVRRWHMEGVPEKIRQLDFAAFGVEKKKPFLHIDMCAEEDEMVEILRDIVRSQVPDATIIVALDGLRRSQ